MDIPKDLHYTNDHEWVRVEGNEAVIGITEYAQGELGDIVFVELPEVGDEVNQGDTFGTIEAVKAAADMYSPVSGEIVAVNGMLDQEPELINNSPFKDGWIVRFELKDMVEVETLLDAEAYQKLVESAKGD